MLNKFTKVSVLVLLMASSVTFTSCKKDNDAPKPADTEQDNSQEAKDKAEQEAKAEKERVAKLLLNKWQYMPVEEPMSKAVVGYEFKADGKVDVYLYDLNGDGEIVPVSHTYILSDDAKQLTIDGKTYDIVLSKTGKTLVVGDVGLNMTTEFLWDGK